MNKLFTVMPEDAGRRLDQYLSESCELTRSAIQKLCDEGLVLRCGKIAIKNEKIKAGDLIEVEIPDPEPTEAIPENIPIEIVYEDSDLLVVNKPKGMVVHPAPGNYTGTLVNALLYHCGDSLSGINGVIRPGIVHRIDKDTSGLLIVAKNDKSHLSLAEQISTHSFLRSYEAVAVGRFRDEKGTVHAPIGRHPSDRKKMAIVSDGRDAITHWQVLTQYVGYTHVKCVLETGRTHQIRVHLSTIGHPLFCDPVYGGGHTNMEKQMSSIIAGQCLHARTIGFVHPITGRDMYFESDLPDYFISLLKKLEERGV
jgi:23S rRNA pseudouridine1911/1915/1917 synthase